jgi:hypothetical protein
LTPSLILLAIGVVVVHAYLAARRSAGKRTRKACSIDSAASAEHRKFSADQDAAATLIIPGSSHKL